MYRMIEVKEIYHGSGNESWHDGAVAALIVIGYQEVFADNQTYRLFKKHLQSGSYSVPDRYSIIRLEWTPDLDLGAP